MNPHDVLMNVLTSIPLEQWEPSTRARRIALLDLLPVFLYRFTEEEKCCVLVMGRESDSLFHYQVSLYTPPSLTPDNFFTTPLDSLFYILRDENFTLDYSWFPLRYSKLFRYFNQVKRFHDTKKNTAKDNDLNNHLRRLSRALTPVPIHGPTTARPD
jgi:hypothetical protein